MFDFSPLAILGSFATALWFSLSPVAIAAIIGGPLVAALGWVALPPRGKTLALALGVILGVVGSLWQIAEAEGARRALNHTHALALHAERERAEKAEAITHDLAEQATRDLADAQADALKLKGFTDALSTDPRRAGVCIDRGLARRLRAL